MPLVIRGMPDGGSRPLLRWDDLRQIGAGARAVARARGRVVGPQRLHGERLAVVALDIAHRARDRRHGGLARSPEALADPRALVAVLVGVERVVPGSEGLAVDDVLGAR